MVYINAKKDECRMASSAALFRLLFIIKPDTFVKLTIESKLSIIVPTTSLAQILKYFDVGSESSS